MELVVKTFHGLEEVLAEELRELGAQNIQIKKRAIACEGDKELVYRANLELRTALRVLVSIAKFEADSEDELYKKMRKVNWEKFMTVDQTFAIDSTVSSKVFTHSKFVAFKVKDAICDFFRDKNGKRPNVDPKGAQIQWNIHCYENRFTLSLDSTGLPLHRRGYRTPGHAAPLNEVLAAGMLMLAGWDGSQPLIDPMCGSGTIPIEAGLIASNTAPGIKRDDLCFMHWTNFDKALWQKLREDAYEKIGYPKVDIQGSDMDGAVLDLAKMGAIEMDLNTSIQFQKSKFEQLKGTPRKGGVVMINPPYGERLKPDDLEAFYTMIGEKLKHNWNGYQAWILTSNEEGLNHIGLKASKKITLYNGSLECKLVCYDMYEGSKRKVRYVRAQRDADS